MKKSKHTPGPWFNEGSHVYTVQGAHYVAETAIERMSFTKRGAEAEANARLIAEAPRMLELLQYLLEPFKTDEDVSGSDYVEGAANAYHEEFLPMLKRIKSGGSK